MGFCTRCGADLGEATVCSRCAAAAPVAGQVVGTPPAGTGAPPAGTGAPPAWQALIPKQAWQAHIVIGLLMALAAWIVMRLGLAIGGNLALWAAAKAHSDPSMEPMFPVFRKLIWSASQVVPHGLLHMPLRGVVHGMASGSSGLDSTSRASVPLTILSLWPLLCLGLGGYLAALLVRPADRREMLYRLLAYGVGCGFVMAAVAVFGSLRVGPLFEQIMTRLAQLAPYMYSDWREEVRLSGVIGPSVFPSFGWGTLWGLGCGAMGVRLAAGYPLLVVPANRPGWRNWLAAFNVAWRVPLAVLAALALLTVVVQMLGLIASEDLRDVVVELFDELDNNLVLFVAVVGLGYSQLLLGCTMLTSWPISQQSINTGGEWLNAQYSPFAIVLNSSSDFDFNSVSLPGTSACWLALILVACLLSVGKWAYQRGLLDARDKRSILRLAGAVTVIMAVGNWLLLHYSFVSDTSMFADSIDVKIVMGLNLLESAAMCFLLAAYGSLLGWASSLNWSPRALLGPDLNDEQELRLYQLLRYVGRAPALLLFLMGAASGFKVAPVVFEWLSDAVDELPIVLSSLSYVLSDLADGTTDLHYGMAICQLLAIVVLVGMGFAFDAIFRIRPPRTGWPAVLVTIGHVVVLSYAMAALGGAHDGMARVMRLVMTLAWLAWMAFTVWHIALQFQRPAAVAPSFCGSCGQPIAAGSQFCGACGQPATASPVPAGPGPVGQLPADNPSVQLGLRAIPLGLLAIRIVALVAGVVAILGISRQGY